MFNEIKKECEMYINDEGKSFRTKKERKRRNLDHGSTLVQKQEEFSSVMWLIY